MEVNVDYMSEKQNNKYRVSYDSMYKPPVIPINMSMIRETYKKKYKEKVVLKLPLIYEEE